MIGVMSLDPQPGIGNYLGLYLAFIGEHPYF